MLERVGSLFESIKRKIGDNIAIYNRPECGIELVYIFGGEYSTEQWESVLSDTKHKKPWNLKILDILIQEVQERTLEERNRYIKELASPKTILIINPSTTEAIREEESRQLYEQFLINLNSMSDTNLNNMKAAIDNLQK